VNRTRLTILTCSALALVYLALMGGWLWQRYRVEHAHVRWSLEAGPMQHTQHGVSDDGTVLLCADSGVIALSPRGRELWRCPYSAQSPWVCYEPVPGGGIIICQTTYDYASQSTALTGSMYLIRPDGLIEWEMPFDFDGNFQGNNVTAELSLFLDGRMLAAHSLRDGRRAWTVETGGTHDNIWPQVDSAGNTYFTTLGNELVSVSPEGEVRWRTAIPDCASALPAVSGACVIYLATADGLLHAIGDDGQERWQRQLGPPGGGGYIHYAEPRSAANSHGTVCVVSELNGLYVYASDGRLQCTYEGLLRSPTAPAISDEGMVYVQDLDGLIAIGPDGQVLWRNATLSETQAQPQLGPDGTLYVMHEDTLYALGP